MEFEDLTNDEMQRLAMMFGCEHSTLLTILTATIGNLRDFPVDKWHPSMAAMFMAVNAMKGAYTAAYVHGDKKVGDHLYKMFQAVAKVIHEYHVEGNQLFGESSQPSQEVPDAFKKAFEQDGF